MPRRGNTVLIVLIVVGVAGLVFTAILAALLLPAVSQAREAARRSQSKQNLKLVGIAAHNYHDVYGELPVGDSEFMTGHSWHTRMLPQMEQSNLFEQIDREQPWNSPANRSSFQVELGNLLNPAIEDVRRTGDGYAVTHYEASSGLVTEDGAMKFREITDGTANTLMGGEVNANFRAWGDPEGHRDLNLGINQNPSGFGSPFTGGAQFVLTDGSVRFISENTSSEILRKLSDPSDGELVDVP